MQLSIHVVLWLHVYLYSLVTPYKLGDMEPTPNERLKIYDEIHQKSVLDFLDRPCGAYYVVGGVAQNVLEGVVIHHEDVVTGGPQNIRTPYHDGALVPKYGFQHLQELVDGGVIWLLNHLWSGVNNVLHYSRPRTMQGGLIPLQDQLYNHVDVLQFYGVLGGHPPFGLGTLKETAESRPKVDEFALDVCQEPAIHVLGHREGDCRGPRTMHILDHDPIEV